MKRKTTLLSLMLLITALTFGQNTSEKDKQLLLEKRLEKRLKASNHENNKINHSALLSNNSRNSKSSLLKSVQASKQRLDSLIWKKWDEDASQWGLNEKEEYTYNGNGNVIKYVGYYKYDNGGQWLADERGEFVYDEIGNIIQEIWCDPDGKTDVWYCGSKIEYSYDPNRNMTQKIKFTWNQGTSQWNVSWKNEYIYDPNDNMTQKIHYDWDDIASQWVGDEKEEFTYDANGNMTQKIEYHWDDNISGWAPVDYKYEYTYDAADYMTQKIVYSWYESASQWDISWKVEYIYNANGLMTQEIPYDWDENTSQWIPHSYKYKREYTYDSGGNITQEIHYHWDESISQWVGDEKEEFTYGANGNRMQKIEYDWQESISQWVAHYKEEYDVDNTYSFNDLFLPPPGLTYNSFRTYEFDNMLKSISSYENDYSDNWAHDENILLYYSEQNIIGINDLETAIVGLYPNPVSEYLNFSFKSNSNSAIFELYDVQGQKLISKEISNNEQLNLSQLDSGLYLYNVFIDGHMESGKLIKE